MYCDVDYIGDKNRQKSISRNVFFFTGGIVSHSSKRQTTVALSTTEAEYYSLGKVVQEALWLQAILKELMYKGPETKTIQVYGDNQSSLNLAENPEFHQCTKHIDVKHYFLREHVEKGVIKLHYIPTGNMVADRLTKPLSVQQHQKFVTQLRMETITV